MNFPVTLFMISSMFHIVKELVLLLTLAFVQTCFTDEIEKLKEEKTKLEDIKERAMAVLRDKEREFAAKQQRLESDLDVAQQQAKQYMDQLHGMGSDSAEASPSVVKIRYFTDVICKPIMWSFCNSFSVTWKFFSVILKVSVTC